MDNNLSRAESLMQTQAISLNIGLASTLIMIESVHPHFFLAWMVRFNVLFRQHPHSFVGGYLAFMASVILVAIPLAVLVEATRPIGALRPIRTWCSGIIAISAIPCCYLLFDKSPWWLVAELGVAIGVVVCVLKGSWVPSKAVLILLAAFHFALWFRFLTHQLYWITVLTSVIVAFLSTIIWAQLTEKASGERSD